MTKISGAIILITGAARGIGAALVLECVTRGAKKIYATDLNMENLQALKDRYPNIVIPVHLDVTNLSSVQSCHAQCGDVDLLINNAGVECATKFTIVLSALV